MKTFDMTFNEELDEYEHWIAMGWGVNRYENNDIFPIISMRDDIHDTLNSHGAMIKSESILRLKELDRKWLTFLEKNRDPSFRFNLRNFNEPKVKWWWWIDRLDELTPEQKSTL